MKVEYYIRSPRKGSVLSTNIKDLSPTLAAKMASESKGATRAASAAFADAIIGDGTHGLKAYPGYKYIRRKRAYGKTFASDRQRRFVMARIREGKIDPGSPHRIGRLQRSWKKKMRGGDVVIYTNAPHVIPVMGDHTQARLNRLVGWRTVSERIQPQIKPALRAANAAIKKYYKDKQ